MCNFQIQQCPLECPPVPVVATPNATDPSVVSTSTALTTLSNIGSEVNPGTSSVAAVVRPSYSPKIGKILPFNGDDKDDNNIKAWLWNFENISEESRWSDRVKTIEIAGKLEGSAKFWFDLLDSDIKLSWPLLKEREECTQTKESQRRLNQRRCRTKKLFLRSQQDINERASKEKVIEEKIQTELAVTS